MPHAARSGRPCVAALCILVPALSLGQGDDFVAPYVPTVEEDVELMLEVGRVEPGDYVIDLGSGDGRIVIAAAKRGALAHGVELNADLVELASANAIEAGIADRVAFRQGDIFQADISTANVVMLYLFPDANLQLRPKLLAELRPGTRVVSNSFHMGDWRPDVHDMSSRSSGGILLWIIPADINGDWALEIDGELSYTLGVEQRYQDIALELEASGQSISIEEATLEGDRVRFRAGTSEARYLFDGRANGDQMNGYVHIERGTVRAVASWRGARR